MNECAEDVRLERTGMQAEIKSKQREKSIATGVFDFSCCCCCYDYCDYYYYYKGQIHNYKFDFSKGGVWRIHRELFLYLTTYYQLHHQLIDEEAFFQ